MRACSKCGELKPLSDYSNETRTALGKLASCKSCNATASKKRYYEQKELKEQGDDEGIKLYRYAHKIMDKNIYERKKSD